MVSDEATWVTLDDIKKALGLSTLFQPTQPHYYHEEAPLAIFCLRGLKQLCFELREKDQIISQHLFTLDYKGHRDLIVNSKLDERADSERRWLVWRTTFTPSSTAIKALFKTRDPQRRDSPISFPPRELIGLLPVGGDLMCEGKIYATLPTSQTFRSFRMHVQADWLPERSRQGLRELEDHPWQVYFLLHH
jgi:hypothetical protein